MGAEVDLPLFRRVPGLRGRVAHRPLGTLPTPVEPLEVGLAARGLWIKRDDLSGVTYGGNKVRKLEFLIAEAERRGAGRLVTAGALGSHHALATAVYGRAAGFRVSLVLCPQPLTPRVREVLEIDRALGADLRPASRMELLPLGMLLERIRRRREGVFVIPPGGSDPLGTLGYVNAALELVEQIETGDLPRPDTVHVACGTMGTAAGLAVGFALADAPIGVEAVRVVGRHVANRPALARLVGRVCALLRAGGRDLTPVRGILERIILSGEQLGEGYGRETEAGRRAAARFREAGIELDPTYTAKTAASLVEAAERAPDAVRLFWHTLSHGIPAVELDEPPPPLPEGIERLLARRPRASG